MTKADIHPEHMHAPDDDMLKAQRPHFRVVKQDDDPADPIWEDDYHQYGNALAYASEQAAEHNVNYMVYYTGGKDPVFRALCCPRMRPIESDGERKPGDEREETAGV